MSTENWISTIAIAGHFLMVLVSVRYVTKTRVAIPLTALGVNVLIWVLAAFAYRLTGSLTWHLVDLTSSPWTPPLMLHVCLGFVGIRPRSRALVLMYLPYALLSLSSAAAFVFTSAEAWVKSTTWSLAFLVLALPAALASLVALARYRRRTTNQPERRRVWIMLIAFAIASSFGLTEVLDEFVAVPRLGDIGTFLGAALLLAAVLRLELLGVYAYSSQAIGLVLLACLVAAGVGLSARALAPSSAFAAVLVVTVLLTATLVVRELAAARHRQLERLKQLAEMGKLSAQLTHDLRNPLAALAGAIDLLQHRSADDDPDTIDSTLELMAAQVERVQRAIEGYERLSRIEPQPVARDLNDLVTGVLALHASQGRGRVAIETTRSPLWCKIDAELVGAALDNLVLNAFQASPDGARVEVKVERAPRHPRAAAISVKDSGSGIDPRTRARLFEEFFTTKPQGKGLGLYFVRRVAEAHGGRVELESAVGQGTTVTLELPLAEGELAMGGTS